MCCISGVFYPLIMICHIGEVKIHSSFCKLNLRSWMFLFSAKVKKEESEKMQEDGIKVKESTTTPSESLPPTGVHISPPPRKRWASSAATNIANDGVNNGSFFLQFVFMHSESLYTYNL